MKITFAIVIKDESKAKSKDTIRTIYLRVTSGGKQFYLDTGQRCAIKNFYNKQNQFVRLGTPYADQINSDLREMLRDAELRTARIIAKSGNLDFATLKNSLLGRASSSTIQDILYNKLEEWQHTRNLAKSSYEIYKTAVDSFVKFCNESNYGVIRHEVVNDYTRSRLFNVQYYRVIRTMVAQLEKSGEVPKFTVENLYTIKPTKSLIEKKQVALIESEVEKFYKLWKNWGDGDQEYKKVIGSFVLLCETGMRHCDLITLNHKEVFSTAGISYIEKIAQKVKAKFAVPLSEVAKEILDYYKSEGKYFDFFKDFTNNRSKKNAYNKTLQKMALKLGIQKHISSHVGRHTFITILSQKGVHTANIQSMVGHSDYRMTEKYKSIDKSTAFKDFFASKSNNETGIDPTYQMLIRRIHKKIGPSEAVTKDLNAFLASKGIHDDVQDYLTYKKTMGAAAHYLIGIFFKQNGQIII